MRYKIALLVAEIEIRWCFLCGKIGEWFLWQEWKICAGREDFDKAIKRLREQVE